MSIIKVPIEKLEDILASEDRDDVVPKLQSLIDEYREAERDEKAYRQCAHRKHPEYKRRCELISCANYWQKWIT